ncbi:MAG: hypothetical protein AUH33_05475 [Chloroflexi bacterium 13_1_40CM_68_21]|nr:MAG: hypothetical protein AUH33_05475 [Chloroflexi bacterium 13_1_40CM_68_21]
MRELIDPIWAAAFVGLLFIAARLLQRAGRAPGWLAPITPAISLGWTVAAVAVAIAIVAALDLSGSLGPALRAPETPILVILAVLVLQVATLLSVAVIVRRQRRAPR